MKTYVVIAREHNQQCARSRWAHSQRRLEEGIGPDQTPACSLVANLILFGLGTAVQRRQVEIGGRAVDRWIIATRPEKRVSDKSGE